MAKETNSRDYRAEFAAMASRRRLYVVRGAVSVVCAIGLACFSIILVLQNMFPLWRFLPLVSFVIFWSGLAAFIAWAAATGVFSPRSEHALAGDLGERTGRGGIFAAALEFSRPGKRHDAYSSFLMSKTIDRAAHGLRAIEPVGMFGDAGRPGWAVSGILVGLVVLLQIGILGADMGRALKAVSDPAIYFRHPRGFNLIVTSGDVSVISGEDVVAEASKFGSTQGDVALRISSVPGVWKRIKLQPDTLLFRRVPVAASGRAFERHVPVAEYRHTFGRHVPITSYRHTFSEVRDEFVYYFEAEGERTEIRKVTVAHRPVINSMRAVLSFPAYTEAPPETISTLSGKLIALVNTRVDIIGETSKEVDEGWLHFSSGRQTRLEPIPAGFRCSFRVQADDTFSLKVSDRMGLGNENSVRYPVIALEDKAPVIELLAPDDEALLPRTLITDLLYRAADDYGISKVRLRYMREGKEDDFRTRVLSLPQEKVTREIEGPYSWSLGGEGVLPGDRILYYLEVFDNNTVTGPGYARTEMRRLLAPSMADIYASIREREAVQRGDMADVLERGREINERLKKLSDDLKAEGKLDWSKRREGQELLEQQKKLQEQIQRAADELGTTLQELEQNRMTSQQIGEKMEKIQSLLRQMENEELRAAIENFRRMLGDIPLKEKLKMLDQVSMDTEQLVNRLDRTIELLEQILKEEKMEELMRRMDELLEQQRSLRDSTRSGDLDELSPQQEKLGEECERFDRDLGEFSQAENDSTFADDMKEMLERMRQAKLQEQMKQAAREMQDGNREQAQCTQSEVINQMLSLYTCLGRCQNAMSRALEREVLEKIERATRELVEASMLEEEVSRKLRAHKGLEGRESLIAEQIVLKEAVGAITTDLYRTARATMAVSGKVFHHLGGALGEMEKSLHRTENKNYAAASTSAGGAYAELNLAVIELLRASSSMGGSGGGAGEQMQMMLEQQLSIHQRLRQLLESGGAGKWSDEERAAMARIAAEQRAMEEILEQILAESLGAGELLGRLDDVADEMEEIARKLERGELDNELVDREERILSRMIESQRSMQRRDYKRERTSRTAGDVQALPSESMRVGEDDREVLLKMIRRAMQEKGPDEYEELIRLYFRALSKQVRERQ